MCNQVTNIISEVQKVTSKQDNWLLVTPCWILSLLAQESSLLIDFIEVSCLECNNTQKNGSYGQIPVVPLNFAALANEMPFERDTVELCVREVLTAFNRSLSSKRNVEFSFSGIGRLSIRNNKVKMKFFKEFINSMDGSGQLLNALKDRPGTVDSVISNRPPTRCHSTNTMVLPRISHSNGNLALDNSSVLPPIIEDQAPAEVMEVVHNADLVDFAPPPPEFSPLEIAPLGEESVDPEGLDVVDMPDEDEKKPPSYQNEQMTSRCGSRMTAPIAKATGVTFFDDFIPSSATPPVKRSLSPLNVSQGAIDPMPPTFERSRSMDSFCRPSPLKVPSPPFVEKPASACGHSNAGQELCYLCHQRARRNIPVSFTDERKKREKEEDKLLQDYQYMKETEAVLTEQEKMVAKRQDQQKTAAFNLGVSEAMKTKKEFRSTNFVPSYIFQRRPLTPPSFIKKEELQKHLEMQVGEKDSLHKKHRADEEFMDRLEQVQLAEDLARQREHYLKDKREQQDMYKRALSAQLRFKPLPLPARVPDSSEPIFGKHDMTNQKMFERRRVAHELYKDQLQTVEQRKRDAILHRLNEQKEEEEVLKKARHNLLDDRADRYERMVNNRLDLEEDWAAAAAVKKQREQEEKELGRVPGVLIQEQCDQYQRCGQCKRRTHNCGESNIWRESRYIPGSRLMV
ncbi:hypothetical protein CAPTEDRAFT_224677 [Capitella teleta]|uniref:CCDC81 HU domain-containing protein n=1 Tax=Capitella teleta TaxID=283909 RepID=R7TWY9_CAPTE|nr:hypothetical protein CAPTEDRAFT_224677 [Capitella teleta]|eukprot:ELT98423.1 hypothetical protein CAPTEDRAFT_224677 [Capitella teleta]